MDFLSLPGAVNTVGDTIYNFWGVTPACRRGSPESARGGVDMGIDRTAVSKHGGARMKSKNTLTIRIPEELKERIETFAAQQGVSINQFAIYALTKQIGDSAASHALRNFTRGVDKEVLFKKVDEILANVPGREVPEWDQMP